MGVSGLYKLIRKYAPECERRAHLSTLTRKRVGVDALGHAYRFAVVQRSGWVRLFITAMAEMVKYRVHPIVVFDGQAPKLKEEEQKKRYDANKSLETRADQLEIELKEYITGGETTETLIKSMQTFQYPILFKVDKEKYVNADHIRGRITKLRSQSVKFGEDEMNVLRELLEAAGIPHVTAPGEAEEYCAKHFDYVYSADSDVLAHGGQVITQIKNGVYTMFSHSDILTSLDLTRESFVDLCILLGTDYNSNIPGIGPVRALQLIQNYGTIEKLPESFANKPLNVDHIAVDEIRDIFNRSVDKNETEDMYHIVADRDWCVDTFSRYNVPMHLADKFCTFSKVVFAPPKE